jgi:hypothetical protein
MDSTPFRAFVAYEDLKAERLVLLGRFSLVPATLLLAQSPDTLP